MNRSGLIFILILIASPALRKSTAWILSTLGRSSRWNPLTETLERLSWLSYPLALQIALTQVEVPGLVQRSLFAILYISYVVIILRWARDFAYSTLDWSTRRAQPYPILKTGFVPLIRNSVTLLVATLALILILQHFGFDVLSLVTALGVSSLAVGLAAKDTLSNMISGFTLIMDRNFQPGDRISISGCSGEVEEIGLRSTRIRSPAGTTWIVPNAELVNTKILNLGPPSSGVQVSTPLKISYESDFAQVGPLAEALFREDQSVDHSRSPQISLQSLNDGVQTLTVTFWVRHPAQADLALSRFLEGWLKRAPQHGIHLAGGAPASLTVLARDGT